MGEHLQVMSRVNAEMLDTNRENIFHLKKI